MTIPWDEDGKRKWKELWDALEARWEAWANFDELGHEAYSDAVTRERIAISKHNYSPKGSPEFVRRFLTAKQEYDVAMKEYQIPKDGSHPRTPAQSKVIQRVRDAFKGILAAYEDE